MAIARLGSSLVGVIAILVTLIFYLARPASMVRQVNGSSTAIAEALRNEPGGATHLTSNESCYIFVYPPAFPLVQCDACSLNAGYRVAQLVVELFNTSAFACSSPSKARWLLFPLDYGCQTECLNDKSYRKRKAHAVKVTVKRLLPLFETQLWRERSRDHLFVFAHDDGGSEIKYREPMAFDEMRKGLFLTVMTGFQPGQPLSYIRGWDVGLPSSAIRFGRARKIVEPLRTEALLARKTMVYWQGGVRPQHSCRVELLAAYAHHPRIRIIDGNGAWLNHRYLRAMNRAIMCLYLGGHKPQRWSSNLGYVLSANCLPLVVNDCCGNPFEDVLPWSNFSVSLTEKQMLVNGSRLLNEIVRDVGRMRRLVQSYNANRKRLMFFEPPQPGDALTTIVESLKLREAIPRPGRGHAFERRACATALSQLKLARRADCGTLPPEVQAVCAWGTEPEAQRLALPT